ncbi:invasion associated locus B family protein [Pelagibacteraceae bacterium]|nr:invasion associated locus B family protein [Pelagibacteraceae bacterium]
MSIIRNFIILIFVSLFFVNANSQEVKKVGKFKDWEAMIIVEQAGIVCFAQSAPVLQAPKSNIREARMFVSFRPGEKINNEISITGGYEFNNKNTITATSGKSKYKFDIAQEGFAWIADNKLENKMIKTMKKGSRIMITGYNQKGSQTIDHYSLLGFTKAYNATKKACKI